jgi:hypothetical protein
MITSRGISESSLLFWTLRASLPTEKYNFYSILAASAFLIAVLATATALLALYLRGASGKKNKKEKADSPYLSISCVAKKISARERGDPVLFPY